MKRAPKLSKAARSKRRSETATTRVLFVCAVFVAVAAMVFARNSIAGIWGDVFSSKTAAAVSGEVAVPTGTESKPETPSNSVPDVVKRINPLPNATSVLKDGKRLYEMNPLAAVDYCTFVALFFFFASCYDDVFPTAPFCLARTHRRTSGSGS
jgi:hypothetical protein